jgi:hypothetical protein
MVRPREIGPAGSRARRGRAGPGRLPADRPPGRTDGVAIQDRPVAERRRDHAVRARPPDARRPPAGRRGHREHQAGSPKARYRSWAPGDRSGRQPSAPGDRLHRRPSAPGDPCRPGVVRTCHPETTRRLVGRSGHRSAGPAGPWLGRPGPVVWQRRYADLVAAPRCAARPRAVPAQPAPRHAWPAVHGHRAPASRRVALADPGHRRADPADGNRRSGPAAAPRADPAVVVAPTGDPAPADRPVVLTRHQFYPERPATPYVAPEAPPECGSRQVRTARSAEPVRSGHVPQPGAASRAARAGSPLGARLGVARARSVADRPGAPPRHGVPVVRHRRDLRRHGQPGRHRDQPGHHGPARPGRRPVPARSAAPWPYAGRRSSRVPRR